MSAVNSQPLPTPWATPRPTTTNNNNNPTNFPTTPNLHAFTTDFKENCRQFFMKLPLLTFLLLCGCIGFYIMDVLFWLSPRVLELLGGEGTTFTDLFTLDPNKVINQYQVWRLISYPFFHSGLLHLTFNLLATIPISIAFEKQHGSVQYFYLLNTVFILVPSVIYSALTLIPLPLLRKLPPTLGLSGIFFTLLVWQVKETPSMNPCVTCNVPSQAYPAVLLVILGLFLPNASFTGHFLGLLVGYAFTFGLLNYWLLREETIVRLEDLSPILSLSRTFPTRFITYHERTFGTTEPTDLPSFFSGQGRTVGTATPQLPTSGSGYHIPFFQSTSDSNRDDSSRSPFSGTGHRLGGS